MRLLYRFLAALLGALFLAGPLSAQAAKLSHDQRELGVAVLREISLREGKLVFRVDSGGCTDASSFKVRTAKEQGTSPKVPHYRLTIERVRIDECKAMLWEGVLIELDLEKDLGLKGQYTIAVDNPVFPGQGAVPRPAPATGAGGEARDPREALLAATVRAIELEIESTRQKLKAAEAGTGSKDNIERFRQKLQGLEVEQAGFRAMAADEYPAPVRQEPNQMSILEKSAGHGAVLPPVIREIVITVDAPLGDGAQLIVEGTSKSGPFYHLAGIDGGDYGILKKGRRYRLTVALVYRREYFGLIGNYFVHVMGVR